MFFFVVWCLFCEFALWPCGLARWFPDVSFYVIGLTFAAALPQHLTLAHCFEPLGSDGFDGLLCCWVFVVKLFALSDLSAEMCAGPLASGW